MIRRTVIAGLPLLAVAACTGPEQPIRAVVTSDKPPLLFSVAEVVISEEVAPPDPAGFRDRRRSARLAEATREFLDDRIEAGGGLGWLQVVIEEARIVEEALPTTGGVRGFFTREPDAVLDALIAVRIAAMGSDGLETASVRSEVSRRRPILQNTSVIAKDAEAERLIGDIMAQLDDTLTQAVSQNLNAFLIY